MSKGMSGHQSARMITDTWLTPPSIIHALGEFDLDPCTPPEMPWETAKKRYTIADNGLVAPWNGRVWLNPPYGRECAKWLAKLAIHGNGIALIFARTETEMFFDYIWDIADGLLFPKGRIRFLRPDGTPGDSTGGAPSVLIGYGRSNADCLEGCGIKGKYVPLNYTPIIVVGVSPTWFSVVCIAVRHYGDTNLQLIYDMVERIAPDKIKRNQFWKEKIRQQMQRYRKQKPAMQQYEVSLNDTVELPDAIKELL
jgi:hypothetical protein